MSSGGQQTSQTQSIPGWLQSAGQQYLSRAGQVANQDYQPYGRQRVADLSPIQRQSIQGLGDLAGGTGSMNAAEDMLTRTMQGGYRPQGVTTGSNPYVGFGPQFQTVMNQGLEDMGEQFGQLTNRTLQRFQGANRNSSAFQQANEANQRALANGMSRYVAGMQNDQFNRSGQLAESGLGRDLSAQQFNAGLGENERNRQMQAVTGASGLMGARGTALTNALNAGDLERRQMQSLLDSQYGDFREWRQHPQDQLGIFGNALAPLFGSAPRSTVTQGPGGDRVAQGLGAWQLASAMGNKGGSGSTLMPSAYSSGASGIGTDGW